MSKTEVGTAETGDFFHDEKGPAALVAGSNVRIQKSAAERKLLLKADCVILPMCGLTWWVTYLDRNSIGNARIMGLQTDLNMSSNQFYNCLTMFFIGYIAFMLPANLTARKFKPNRAVGAAVLGFGAVLVGMAGAKNYSTVLALRILLGLGQAFVQMLSLYMSLWYKRDELATRNAIYYSCAVVSGAFGGLISYGIQTGLPLKTTGRAPWSWLFIVEGSMAMGIGILAWLLLPRFPDDLQKREKRHWLFTREEINIAVERFASYNTVGEKVQTKQLIAVLKDPKSYFYANQQGASVLGISVVGSFLPSFIKDFGFSPIRTQLFTIVPYACAFVSILLAGALSDRLNRKAPFCLIFFSLGCLGYILLLVVESTATKIVATCLVTSGCYTCTFLSPVWQQINTIGYTKRGATWAFLEVFGLCYSIMGTRIYNTPPRYIKGHSVVLGLNAFALLNVVFVYLWMRYKNRQKDRIEGEYAARGEVHPHVANEISLGEAGEDYISFRYIL
ncbi:uncharacterized protein Z518_04582 [Rhinocladiella mackenziei CBS 650.93]|uniref:Rhinocladiella mackenziei CBS 650.93 unplaced genomic scaffold supercont1.3, whole genome shotgun sequence n=1 Tax=Rhinocladiella mackenziei CBS 650.93 TaxID=1442369 RepID=A0A0D2ITW3_9EURO|nr:uncharacterized protein Z518_04582 [Rhinocladiella mackenziei CBS 650.93]KIX06606.1 hypothetical protein Z518_04582 [Rhinocladiella mackenziei CBS 650.93]